MKKENPRKTKLIHSSVVACPVCSKKKFKVVQRLDNIPCFGEVLQTFANCDSCNYKTNDILPLTSNPYPKKHKTIVSKKSLSYRVIKGKYCEITIPELGLKISPGPSSESYISNVEGVIDRTVFVLKGMKVSSPEKSDSIEKIIKKLMKSKKTGNLTLIFEDKMGQSAIFEERKNN